MPRERFTIEPFSQFAFVVRTYRCKKGELALKARAAAEKTLKAISAAIEHDDTQSAIAWTKKPVSAAADEAVTLGKTLQNPYNR